MSFFKFLGMALVLTVIVVCWVGCGSSRNPSALVGSWKYFDGETGDIPRDMELFKDGTGMVDENRPWTGAAGTMTGVTWKVENQRLVFLIGSRGLSCSYNVSGYELVLTMDNHTSVTFVKEDHVGEYVKKRVENEKQRIEKISNYFTDSRDGHKYRTVKIGNHVWMAENLNFQTGKSWCSGKSIFNEGDPDCSKYGRLYDWETAKTACPNEYHLPTRDEWDELIRVSGGTTAGRNLKSTKMAGLDVGKGKWADGCFGVDAYGFSALPGGERSTNGYFNSVGGRGFWWTSTNSTGNNIYFKQMVGNKDNVEEEDYTRGKDGYSVRCIHD
jgi:uncharacterized protein (TIGR02145 family)